MTNFEKIQKAALARLDAGEELEYILQDYADYEDELRPILEEASGISLSTLMQSPKVPKAKLKAKNQQPANMLMLVLLGLVVLLAAGVFVYANMQPTMSITTLPISVTTVLETAAPVIIEATSIAQIIEVDNSACDTLGQQSLNALSVQPETQAQQGSTGSDGEREATSLEVTPVSGDLAFLPTASPMATSPMPESMPPVEAPILESSASTGSTFGGGGGGGIVGDSASGEGASAALPADGTTSEVAREESSDMAVVSGGVPIVATSVMSYDEAERDTDDYEVAPAIDSRGESTSVVANQAPLQPLNAGEIDDNADWDTYQEYRRNFLTQSYLNYGVRDLDTTDRQIISVVDSNGLPVLGACVQIYYGDSFITASRTYATGLTLFFPNLSEATRYRESFRVLVSKAGLSAETTLDRSAIGGLTTVTLPLNQAQQSLQLDVMFLLDATGSMSDEIEQLQTNILSISAQLDALPNNIDVHFGLVAYRDRGEEYITRVYDFTDDVQLFQSNLRTVEAGGGGDYPESLNEGFDRALNAVNWRGGDTIKLVFLVADAPPHVDYANDADYSILMQDALARGIKVHPIASSGLQPEGEFILRQIGQFTMGHFLFLTYEGGVSGTVGEDRPDLEVGEARDEQGIGDYSVAQLDELVLRLITDEIAALQGE
jgi:hypothetical protein